MIDARIYGCLLWLKEIYEEIKHQVDEGRGGYKITSYDRHALSGAQRVSLDNYNKQLM